MGRAQTVAMLGLDAIPVEVEAHASGGLPGFHVIGASGSAGGQGAERVRTAVTASGVTIGNKKVLLSLAPADVPKAGARFDLAMAVAVLLELGGVASQVARNALFIGELALDGGVRGVPGVLPSAAYAAQTGRRLYVAMDNAAEAALISGVDVVGVASLQHLLEILTGVAFPSPVAPVVPTGTAAPADLREVRGQPEARRALEIAAAGGHHVLLLGPPGCGKSMLAKRLPSILPPLSDASALELAAIRSVAGVGSGHLDRTPPFRAPHHGISAAALFGGGTGVARPGELSLAHRGVLFVDELYEWQRGVIEGLRQPLEEGVVRIARSRATVAYPARVQLVAAANPCPCGGGASCTCTDDAIWTYRSRLSGPLADRLDLAPAVHPLTADDLLQEEPGEDSASIARRVAAARGATVERWGVAANAEVDAWAVRTTARPAALRVLADAVEAGDLTGRGYDRALRVARTCADLEGNVCIETHHVLEAHAHRMGLRGTSTHRAGAGVRS